MTFRVSKLNTLRANFFVQQVYNLCMSPKQNIASCYYWPIYEYVKIQSTERSILQKVLSNL